MSVQIISDKPLPKWAREMVRDIEAMLDRPVSGYALVGIMKPEADIGPYVKYVDLSLLDRITCAGVIQYDLADKAAGYAIKNYMGEEDDDDEEETEG